MSRPDGDRAAVRVRMMTMRLFPATNRDLSPLLLLLFLGALGLAGTAEAVTDTFVASGTWTAPAGVTSVSVEVWGGGGAGGGNPTTTDGGGGGGGGAYSMTATIAVIPGNNYTVTVGAGGIGGTGTGGAGGDSWFSTAGTILAKGGAGGNPPVGGAGGVAGAGGAAASGIGTTKFSGGNGGTGRNSNTGRGAPGGSSAGTAANGTNGPNPWSTAAAAAPPAGGGIGGNGGNADGQNGFAPASGNGGGGGGGAELSTTGGNGAGGKVAITYTPPAAVTSIDCIGTCTTNAASVSWLVTFNTSVTGGSSSNFTLVNTGLGGTPAITSVTGSGATRTVTASTGTGSGTLGLNMISTTGVSPALTGLPFTGQVFTLDRTAPVVSSIVRADPSPTALASVSWTVTFSKNVTGVNTADFALAQAGGVSGATITGVTPVSGTVYTVTATTGTGNGTLGLNLVDDDSITDAVTNPLGGAGAGNGNFTGEVYVVNKPVSATASPTACVDDAGIGTQTWGTLTGPLASDDSYASASVDDNQTTHFLKCTGYGFAIPLGATITGITVHVERKSTASLTQDAAMRLVKGGVIGATDRATATAYTTTDTVEDHGGTTDLWGTTWTPADINAADFGAAFAAQKAGAAGGARTVTVDHMAITVSYTPPPTVATPGDFNAFESGTTPNPGATTGRIYTKLVSAGFTLDVVAILSSAQHATFTDTVQVDLVTGATGGLGCGSPTAIAGTSQNVNLTGGRGTTAAFGVAAAYPDVRVRIRYPVASPTVTSCSTDNFSNKPTAFTITSTDATNVGTSGGTPIKTGANFNLTAAGGAGYVGTPSGNFTGNIVGTPNAGTIGGSFVAAVGGTASGTFYYSEVGNFGLSADAVRDTAFTATGDQAGGDCIASSTSEGLSGGKYGCWVGSNAVTQSTGVSGFGRFIPDNFNVTYTTPPIFGTLCGTFSYVGTVFTYPTAVMTVTARNGTNNGLTNATTTNYAGLYTKLTNGTLTPATQDARYTRFEALGVGNTPALNTSGLPATAGDPAISAFTNGVATLTFSSGTGLEFIRSTTTPNAPFDADIALALNVIDSDGVVFGSNPASFGTAVAAGSGISFSGGKAMRFGRLAIGNANGSSALPLPVRVEAQYWNGKAFITNAIDACTPIAASVASSNINMTNYTAPLTDSPKCLTALSGGGTLVAGRLTLQLAAPNVAGSVDLTVNLGAVASGNNTCLSAGASPTAETPANRAYLQSGTGFTQNPSARATFGIFRGSEEVIFIRENF